MPSIRLMRLGQPPSSGRKSPVCDLNRGRRRCSLSLSLSLSLSESKATLGPRRGSVLSESATLTRISGGINGSSSSSCRAARTSRAIYPSPEIDPDRSSRLTRRADYRDGFQTEFDEFLKKKRDPHRAPPAIAHPREKRERCGGARGGPSACYRTFFARQPALRARAITPRLASPLSHYRCRLICGAPRSIVSFRICIKARHDRATARGGAPVGGFTLFSRETSVRAFHFGRRAAAIRHAVTSSSSCVAAAHRQILRALTRACVFIPRPLSVGYLRDLRAHAHANCR